MLVQVIITLNLSDINLKVSIVIVIVIIWMYIAYEYAPTSSHKFPYSLHQYFINLQLPD
jgi:hypothetical protein